MRNGNVKDPRAAQLATLRIALRVSRQRCASLERVVARLEAMSPCTEHEKEIFRLEQRCIDLEDRWEEAEGEVYDLRKALGWQERWAG